MVPMLTCGLVRWNFAFATVDPFPSGTVPGLCSPGCYWILVLVNLVGGTYSPVAFAVLTARLRARCAPRTVAGPTMLTRPSPSLCLRLGPGLAALLGPWAPLPCSLAPRLRDDLLGHVLRDLGIAVELHGVVRAALRLGAQVPHVAEHLRQRDERLHHPGTAALLHGLDLATAGVQVADHVAHIVFGRDDLNGHHRLEQDRIGLARGSLEDHRTGDLECHLLSLIHISEPT